MKDRIEIIELDSSNLQARCNLGNSLSNQLRKLIGRWEHHPLILFESDRGTVRSLRDGKFYDYFVKDGVVTVFPSK